MHNIKFRESFKQGPASSLRLFLATRQIKPAAPCLKLPRNLILCINKFEIIFLRRYNIYFWV